MQVVSSTLNVVREHFSKINFLSEFIGRDVAIANPSLSLTKAQVVVAEVLLDCEGK